MEILTIHCQSSAIIMINGIRKVKQGVDIFDKRMLDYCKIHLLQKLVHGTNIERIEVFPMGLELDT